MKDELTIQNELNHLKTIKDNIRLIEAIRSDFDRIHAVFKKNGFEESLVTSRVQNEVVGSDFLIGLNKLNEIFSCEDYNQFLSDHNIEKTNHVNLNIIKHYGLLLNKEMKEDYPHTSKFLNNHSKLFDLIESPESQSSVMRIIFDYLSNDDINIYLNYMLFSYQDYDDEKRYELIESMYGFMFSKIKNDTKESIRRNHIDLYFKLDIFEKIDDIEFSEEILKDFLDVFLATKYKSNPELNGDVYERINIYSFANRYFLTILDSKIFNNIMLDDNYKNDFFIKIINSFITDISDKLVSLERKLKICNQLIQKHGKNSKFLNSFPSHLYLLDFSEKFLDVEILESLVDVNPDSFEKFNSSEKRIYIMSFDNLANNGIDKGIDGYDNFSIDMNKLFRDKISKKIDIHTLFNDEITKGNLDLLSGHFNFIKPYLNKDKIDFTKLKTILNDEIKLMSNSRIKSDEMLLKKIEKLKYDVNNLEHLSTINKIKLKVKR